MVIFSRVIVLEAVVQLDSNSPARLSGVITLEGYYPRTSAEVNVYRQLTWREVACHSMGHMIGYLPKPVFCH